MLAKVAGVRCQCLEHTGFLPWNASQLRREEAFRLACLAQYQKPRDRESQAGQRRSASRIGVGRPEAWPWLCLAEGLSRGLTENLLKSSPVPLLSSLEALATAVTRPLSALLPKRRESTAALSAHLLRLEVFLRSGKHFVS